MVQCTLANGFRVHEARREEIEKLEKLERDERNSWMARFLTLQEEQAMKPKKGCKGGK